MCPRCTELDKAAFEPFIERDANGRVTFANRMRGDGRRFRDRNWPVFQRSRKQFRPTRRKLVPVCPHMVSRSIKRASKVCEARRWLSCNPLFAHQMRVEDARRLGRAA